MNTKLVVASVIALVALAVGSFLAVTNGVVPEFIVDAFNDAFEVLRGSE